MLNRLRHILKKHELKLIIEGLVNSKIRYCISVYGAESLRVNDADVTKKSMHDLQVLQNDAMRIVTNHKRSEHIHITDMLHETRCLSVNQILAYTMLLENWKASNFKVPVLGNLLIECTSSERTLRSETARLVRPCLSEAYSLASTKLWNLASSRFRTTNLLSIAKIEARNLIKTFPL